MASGPKPAATDSPVDSLRSALDRQREMQEAAKQAGREAVAEREQADTLREGEK